MFTADSFLEFGLRDSAIQRQNVDRASQYGGQRTHKPDHVGSANARIPL